MTKKEKIDQGCPEGVDASSSNKALIAEEISDKYTVRELREILRENGLSVSGKKPELVERVLPILNDDSNETTDDASNDDSISSTLTNYGINYGDLAIQDESLMEDNAELNIEGFTQNGLIMSDSTISVVSSDSSNVDLKIKVPEVSYSDFESTVFTFKNLDLSILPSSNPQSLELSALMDSLEVITDRDYVNLKGLNLFSKSFPDDGVGIVSVGFTELFLAGLPQGLLCSRDVRREFTHRYRKDGAVAHVCYEVGVVDDDLLCPFSQVGEFFHHLVCGPHVKTFAVFSVFKTHTCHKYVSVDG